MKNIVLIYGIISGCVLAAFVALLLPFAVDTEVHREHGLLIGYSVMVLAFTAVFLGVRSYREKFGGTISFGRALGVGLLIVLIASTFYVVAWEFTYFNFMPDYLDKYAAVELQKMQAKGASAAEMATARQEMEHFKTLYANPFINVGMTFMEIVPVGLVMALVSAAILRRKTPPAMATATA
ncbi:MAG TPA: DUF4199 domain-containing protein [Thermoanaerobaculia bacterium]|jgi:CBS domain containing-hemolysin-like protein|nr:DUF4199 domain-containing protein [Thermoanaerobaculia bacterium]